MVSYQVGMRTAMRSLEGWPRYAALVLLGTSAAFAQGREDRARQLEYDPQSGQWIESEPPVPDTPLGDLQLARRAFAREEYGRAHRRIKKWLKTYGSQDPLYPEALLFRAEVEIARREYYKAHKHLQEFRSEFGLTNLADRAAEFEAHAQSRSLETEDAQEGIRALLEKRPPKFSGR